jgi:hypothetical protein
LLEARKGFGIEVCVAASRSAIAKKGSKTRGCFSSSDIKPKVQAAEISPNML